MTKANGGICILKQQLLQFLAAKPTQLQWKCKDKYFFGQGKNEQENLFGLKEMVKDGHLLYMIKKKGVSLLHGTDRFSQHWKTFTVTLMA